jgi:hypothetical protein
MRGCQGSTPSGCLIHYGRATDGEDDDGSHLAATAPARQRVRASSVTAGSWPRARRARGSRMGDLNPPSPCCSARGAGREGPATCGSAEPAVTVGARWDPLVADAVRTQGGPGTVAL